MLFAFAVPFIAAGLVIAAGPASAAAAAAGSAGELTQAQQLVTTSDLSVQQWGFRAVGGPAALAASRGDGIVVAVVDTGVDGTHPDLTGRVLAGMDFTSTIPRVLPAGLDSDPAGHGTHVSGIIAAADDGMGITGIAPGALILPVRVIGPGVPDSVMVKAIPKGILWAAVQGASVINLSLGGSVDDLGEPARTAICDAVAVAAKTAVVIVASGNEGEEGNPLNVPASCPGALSVTSVGPDLRASHFTSFDATAGISAPGTDVLSTAPLAMSRSGYEEWSGTSMAAPHVSGAAALAVATHAGWPASEIGDLLRATATDLGPEGLDPMFGAGLVNASAAAGGRAATVGEVFHLRATAGFHNRGRVLLSWVPPGSAVVDRYEVSALGSDLPVAVVPGGDVRTLLDTSLLDGASTVIVTAVTRSGQRIPSAPLVYAPRMVDADDRAETPVLAGFAARWVPAGLMVTWKRSGSDGLIRIEGRPLFSETVHADDVRADAGRMLIAVPAGSDARSSRVFRVVALSGNELLAEDVWVAPQYGVRVDVSRAGARHMIIVGDASCAAACGGRTVTFSSASGKVIGVGVSNVSGRFAVTVPLTSSSVRAVFGAERSNWVKAGS